MLFETSRAAGRRAALLAPEKVNATLMAVADTLIARQDELIAANSRDLEVMDPEDSRYDRLKLTPLRIADIADGIRAVVALPSPLNIELESIKRPNGMLIRKVTVPFGVIGAIFEARPNVIFDIFALCFKAGSACILKGGHEAQHSDKAAIAIIRDALEASGVDVDTAVLLPATHEAGTLLMGARNTVDLLIPRGSRKLIDYVREHSRVPVIETGAGVCHTYFHASGDIATGRDIIFNAKTRRYGVCNAMDCLVIDRSRLDSLPALCYHLAEKEVHIHADEEAYNALYGAYPFLEHASHEDFGHEWLSANLTVKTVEDIAEAIDFINTNGSKHSECIVAENQDAKQRFLMEVDAACVYANVSTAFTDGAQFGFGAEIGISTQKLHARGPMALREITSYKYLITGAGQVRQ